MHHAVVDFASHTDMRALALVGGVGPKTQIAALEQGAEVVVATPGRFMELYLKGALVVNKLQAMVLDEADRMMDMGFMPQLRDILEVVPRKRQNLLVQRDLPTRVERLADEFLLWPTRIEVAPEGTPVSTVDQHMVKVPNLQTKLNLLSFWLTGKHQDSRALVFVRTKEDARKIRQALEAVMPGLVGEIHSNKAQHTRLAAMNQFCARRRARAGQHRREQPWHRRARDRGCRQFHCAQDVRRLRAPHWSDRPGQPFWHCLHVRGSDRRWRWNVSWSCCPKT